MAYPVGMATFQKTFGPAYAMGSGDLVRMVVSVTPSTSAVWAATATPLVAFCRDVEASAGLQGLLTLPSPDQDGFIDTFGNTVRNWTYLAEVKYFDSDGRFISSTSVNFTHFATLPNTSDLESSIPLPGTSGERVAVTVPTSAALDGDDLVLYDVSGAEMFRGDVRGPTGGGGSGGGSAGFQYTQAVAAAQWSISHTLARRPSVTLYDQSGNLMLADITATSSLVTVTFAAPIAGSAVLV